VSKSLKEICLESVVDEENESLNAEFTWNNGFGKCLF